MSLKELLNLVTEYDILRIHDSTSDSYLFEGSMKDAGFYVKTRRYMDHPIEQIAAENHNIVIHL